MRAVDRVRVEVPAEAAWRGLTEPALMRTWYFDLEPAGPLSEGATREWRRGQDVVERAVVTAVEPGRRLAYETRMLFAPRLAELPPVAVAWTVQPDGGGCEVELAVESADENATYRMFEREGRGLLLGLRLAVDPGARAELARLEEIDPVEVRDLTPERLADYQRFFDHDAFRDYPQWSTCYCMETHFEGSPEEAEERTGDQNRADMSRLIGESRVTALIAYSGGRPVGWCNYGPTTRLAGLTRKLELDAADHEGVGSIACFVVAAPYRGHGVATRLLEAALERLHAAGCRVVEAYPTRSWRSAQGGYRGPLEMYLEAGFRPYREKGAMVVVRKELA